MDRSDVLKIMAVLRGAYPAFYRDIKRAEAEDTVRLWEDMFSTDEAAVVGAAVKSLIAGDTRGYPPTIGQVKEKMRLISEKREMTEAEAWNLVRKAAGNGIHNAGKEFDKLPEIVQRLVGSPNQLREWAMMDVETLNSVVASNFQRAYRARASYEREMMALPADVRETMEQIAAGMKMPELPESGEAG